MALNKIDPKFSATYFDVWVNMDQKFQVLVPG